MTIPEDNIRTKSISEAEPLLRDLFLFTAENRTFGVPAEEVEGTAEAKCPAPLPHAPAAILGVVYARGRVLTLIDPLIIAGDGASPRAQPFSALIALRGDEQLALAADSISETITISYSDIEPPSDAADTEPISAIAGILRHGGKKISILDPARLFDAAVQRKDRRRRRF
jgi:chemotaxis signal transduction protein